MQLQLFAFKIWLHLNSSLLQHKVWICMSTSHLWEQSFILLLVYCSKDVTKDKLCECAFMWSIVGRISAKWHTRSLHIWGGHFGSHGKCWELLLPLRDRCSFLCCFVCPLWSKYMCILEDRKYNFFTFTLDCFTTWSLQYLKAQEMLAYVIWEHFL